MSSKSVISESKRKNKKRRPGKLAIAAGLIGAALLVGSAGIAEKYHNDFSTPNSFSGIMEDIKGIPTELQYTIAKWQQDREIAKRLSGSVPSTYDNEADNQTIQSGINAVPASSEELPSLLKDTIKPLEKGKWPRPTIFLPLRLVGTEKVHIETEWVKGAFDPIDSSGSVAFGKIFTVQQKDTEVIVPVEGATVYIATTRIEGKDYLNQLDISFEGTDNTIYNLVVSSPDDVRDLQPTDIITEALASGKKSVDVQFNTAIAKTAFNDVELIAEMFTGKPLMRTGFFVPDPSSPTTLNCDYNLLTKEQDGRTLVAFLPQGQS